MINTDRLRREQIKLSKKIIAKDGFDLSGVEYVAGVDQAIFGKKMVSAIVILDFKTKEIVEKKYGVVDINLPYVPGYLSYRESPAVIEAYHQLERDFDILFVDGNGILHPRKAGLASQLGLMLDKPTIGVAKKLLLGEIKQEYVYIDGEKRGQLLHTRKHANPIYVSLGHLISLKTAVTLCEQFVVHPHKLPEPVHLAHQYANKVKKKLMQKEGDDHVE